VKKVTALVLVGLMLLTVVALPASAAEGKDRGGFMGFIAGCCFGIRAGGAYNSGKEIHWREWCRLIPYVNIIFAVWDGIDGMHGVTTADLATKYGAVYY
jgi:hypothetical protein